MHPTTHIVTQDGGGKIPASVTRQHRCQDWVVCIIATIVLPELLRRSSLVKIVGYRRGKCARYPDTLRFAAIQLWSAVTEQLIPSRKLLPNHHQVGESGPFRPRITFWRGTP